MGRYYIRPWLERRPFLGQHERLVVELRKEDVSAFSNFERMDPGVFRKLLRLGPRLAQNDTWCRKTLNPSLKLALTSATWQNEIAIVWVSSCS